MSSGAVALFLAGIGFELAQAVKLAAALYISAEGLLIIVLHRAGYLQHNRENAILILIVAATSLFMIWKLLMPTAAISKDASVESGTSSGAQIHIVQRKLFPPDPSGDIQSAYVNLQFQPRGDRSIFGVVHNHVVFISERLMDKQQIDRLFAPLRVFDLRFVHDEIELGPDSLHLVTLPQKDDEEAKKITKLFPLIRRREVVVYSLIVFRYRYKGMPEGLVRVTENCAWFAGNPDSTAWVTVWNRTYDLPQK